LLWVLVQNGALLKGSVLFWDEPETNLNPKLMRAIITLLIELQRMGVQVFLTTHDYVILKEFDLQILQDDQVLYHSLYRNKNEEIALSSTAVFLDISPNSIDDTFGSIIGREIEQSMEGLGQ